jgi:hypothetical protein
MSYCRDHDPILVAGSITCGECKAKSCPVTAEWLTDTLVLASYDQHHERGCSYRDTAGVVLIDLDAASETVPAIRRPRRCRAIAASTGRPCRGYARPGSGYCPSHQAAQDGAR